MKKSLGISVAVMALVIASPTFGENIEDFQYDSFQPGRVPNPDAPAYHLEEGGKYDAVREAAANADPDLKRQKVRPSIENSDTSIVDDQPKF